MTCALCGINAGNTPQIPVRRYHLRPAKKSGLVAARTGTMVVGRIDLCDRCVLEQRRGATGNHPDRPGDEVAVA